MLLRLRVYDLVSKHVLNDLMLQRASFAGQVYTNCVSRYKAFIVRDLTLPFCYMKPPICVFGVHIQSTFIKLHRFLDSVLLDQFNTFSNALRNVLYRVREASTVKRCCSCQLTHPWHNFYFVYHAVPRNFLTALLHFC